MSALQITLPGAIGLDDFTFFPVGRNTPQLAAGIFPACLETVTILLHKLAQGRGMPPDNETCTM